MPTPPPSPSLLSDSNSIHPSIHPSLPVPTNPPLNNHIHTSSSSSSSSSMTTAASGSGGGGGGDLRTTHLHDLPDVILTNIFGLVSDVRSRNNMSLTSHKWLDLERSTRCSLSLRGNVRTHFLHLPTSFSSVSHLDLSLLSPWGHPFPLLPHPHPHHHHLQENNNEHDDDDVDDDGVQDLISLRLRQAFPNLQSLTVYARTPSTLRVLAPLWPTLRRAALVRWHQRPPHDPPGADLEPLFASCPLLSSLDLSRFYCWTEDIPAALLARPASASALTSINLLSASLMDGFRSSEIIAISSVCPNLRCFLAPCVCNPMHFNFVGDDALLAVAANCPRLTQLHLVDPNASDVFPAGVADSGISGAALRKVFTDLSRLEDLALDVGHWVRDAGPALEVLGNRKMRVLKLGHFQGICRAVGWHLDGVSVCGGLQSLSIKNAADDLTDSGLVRIAQGCSRLSKLELHGCSHITESGMNMMVEMLQSTLVDVKISGCSNLNASDVLRALGPVRERIQRLHIDCIWFAPRHSPDSLDDSLTQVLDETAAASFDYFDSNVVRPPNKRCRYSENNGFVNSRFWCHSWRQLRYLSVWLPAGEVLNPLPESLGECPELEEICIKVEGDCRTCPRPEQPVFGLSYLALYPKLAKMKLDLGDAIGYALTAPMGQMDLSLWERFYLHGIESLTLLDELNYWPPQDREVNQRSLSLPAAALIPRCQNLRKLFIHGTAHEHFMRFFLEMPNLRDVQLREDYYPAPENDMSTEMRVDSCSRFEDALNSRPVPD